MTEVPLFEAKCAECGQTFGCPSFGDLGYGLGVLWTRDGRHCRSVDAFDAFAQRVARHVEGDTVWRALAALADPVEGMPLTVDRHCPNCGGSALEYWEGAIVGSIDLLPATFAAAALLDDSPLADRVRRANAIC
jgi:hypothetical protein